MYRDEIKKSPWFKKIIMTYPMINQELIIKDMYLTKVLYFVKDLFKELNIEKYYLRGGTFLSKCFRQTNRLSEDIDLTIIAKSKSQARRKLLDISNKLDQLTIEKGFEITFRDEQWNCPRNYLHTRISYEGVQFEIDIKSVEEDNIINQPLQIVNREIYDISKKFSNELEGSYIFPTINLELVVAEKLIGFHKSKDVSDKRHFRHIYDIYMIFHSNLLTNNKETWDDIKQIYQIVVDAVETKYDIDNVLAHNICFDDNYISNKDFLKQILFFLRSECYGNVEWNKIINFYANLKEELI